MADREHNQKFEPVELRGGPHHGQTMWIPRDQTEIVLHDDATPTRYHRLDPDKPVLFAESMFGGGGKAAS